MKKLQPVLFAALAGSLLLSGCQTIRSHNPFRHREPDYKSAQQENPLEVPPGLDNPPASEALTIPQAGSGATPPVLVNGQPVGNVGANSNSVGAAPAPPSAVVSGNSLTLTDQPDNAYRRVGLALERGGVGTVSGHDDSSHTYQVAVNSVVEVKSQGGFMHRIFHHSHNETVTGTVTVSVAPSGSGSVVNVQGDQEAVERVLAVLQQRLGGG